ncbi:MAG: ThuA domain-containing protein, partial [Anaerolineae bacterium]|nr:ThuA domain-containing protein [Anaerolineae bacterium]
MTEILYVSDGFFHPPRQARQIVRDVVTAVPGIQITQVKTLNHLLKLDMTRFKALVLYVHHKHIALDTLAALEQFVQKGGGLLAIHSATASFKEQPRYAELVGGRFTGHGPVEPITIRPAAANDEIFGEIGAFTVTDELYLHELQP